MSFKKEVPSDIALSLKAVGLAPNELLIFTESEIDREGKYCQQWLAVDKDTIAVISDSPSAQVILNIAIADIAEFRSTAVIGSGIVQALMKNGSYFVDVIRYKNSQADKFHKIARKLDRYLGGTPIEEYPEDSTDARRCMKCSLMLGSVGEVCPRCISKGVVFSRLLSIIRPYRFAALGMLGLLLVGICLDLVPPQLTRLLVDDVLKFDSGHSSNADISKNLVMLLWIVAALACVQVFRMLINIVNGRLTNYVGTAITCDMRNRLVEHIQKLSISYFDKQQVGSLVSRIANDTEALHGLVAQLAGGFIFQILMVMLVGVMMFSMNPELAFYTMIPAPLVITGSIIFWRYIYPRYYKFWDSNSKQMAMLSGFLTGIRVVKAFGQEDRELNRFETASGNVQKSRRNVDSSTAVFNPVMGLIFQLGGWIVWYVGGKSVLHQTMTLGELMAFLGYLWMFYAPLTALTQFTNWLTQVLTQAHRIFEILDVPQEIQNSKNPLEIKVQGMIKFEDVSFGYNRYTPILKDIDLEINKGEMIGIVGRSGSGKTTIVNMICRFYDVNEGRVLIDGIDVRDLTVQNLRSQIGVVLQEPFLFRGSILKNITYGIPEIDFEKVLASSKAANCHGFIMRSNFAYDTWVGERGTGLSGGERQRVSIARVLLIDPKILILDEATSSVDAESEAAIQNALKELVKGRTTIAIAHRLSTLRIATRIIVLDSGKIVESGTHDDLLEQKGLYSKLFSIQGQFSEAPSVDKLHSDKESQVKAVDIPDFKVKWLEPSEIRIERGEHLSVDLRNMDDASIYHGVYAALCRPVEYKDKYISIRYAGKDKRDTEIGIIRDLHKWPEDQKKLIEESLLRKAFIHIIKEVHDIKLFQGYLTVEVLTDLGPKSFVMKWQGECAHDYGSNGKMIIDTDENRYLIPDLGELPSGDRELFTRFVYW